MLGGDVVGDLDHLGIVVADDDGAIIAPGLRCYVGSRQNGQQSLDLRHCVTRQFL